MSVSPAPSSPPPQPDPAATTSLTPVEADPLKRDFRNFLWYIWKHLGLPEPTWAQYDVASFLQHGPRRLVVMAFRGMGKSWITAAYICWLYYCDIDHKVMAVSATAPKAAELTTFVLRLLHDVDILQHLTPGDDQRKSMVSFDVRACKPDIAPSLKSVGINGQLAGSRSNTIVADDIEIPHNSDTEGKREKLLEAVKEFDAVLKPGGKIVYLGTPQSEASIYNTLPDRGYVIRIWPARYPKDPEEKLDPLAYADLVYGNRLAPEVKRRLRADISLSWTPTDPKRFTHEDLQERELSYGRSGFALQFQLNTNLSDLERYPLKLADLIVFPLDPLKAPIDFAWAGGPDTELPDLPSVGLVGDRYHRPMWTHDDYSEYESGVMYVDPSGRGKDETAYAVVKLLHGRMFLHAWGGFRGGYDDATLEKLIAVARKHGIKLILCEPNFGGGMFTKMLLSKAQAMQYLCGVEDAEWSSTMKEQRVVDTLEPVLNQHRLVVAPAVIKADYDSITERDGDTGPRYRGFYQMARMVRARGALAHDDRIDALTGAVAYFTDAMARDLNKAVEDHAKKALDEELRRFMDNCLQSGGPPQRPMASTIGKLKGSVRGPGVTQ